jgi:hypothetical protein
MLLDPAITKTEIAKYFFILGATLDRYPIKR